MHLWITKETINLQSTTMIANLYSNKDVSSSETLTEAFRDDALIANKGPNPVMHLDHKRKNLQSTITSANLYSNRVSK